MVGPSLTEEKRENGMQRLRYGFVGLVGASAGLTAVQAGASLVIIALAACVGLVVGGALLWYLDWSLS